MNNLEQNGKNSVTPTSKERSEVVVAFMRRNWKAIIESAGSVLATASQVAQAVRDFDPLDYDLPPSAEEVALAANHLKLPRAIRGSVRYYFIPAVMLDNQAVENLLSFSDSEKIDKVRFLNEKLLGIGEEGGSDEEELLDSKSAREAGDKRKHEQPLIFGKCDAVEA